MRQENTKEYVVEMHDIVKTFSDKRANDEISIGLRHGEIHALLGENGAGKSTLMSVLFGIYRADSGRIIVRGKQVEITNPNVATELGIGMVHQHFKLVPTFTVTENIILGLEPTRGISLDIKKATEKIRQLSEKYGLDVDPNAKIENISVGMQQRVEIIKMLYRNAEILIFDEPTSVLTPMEIQELIKIMRSLIAEGKSIFLITHKLKEIKQIADVCTIIRLGKVIGTVDVQDTTEEEMAKMMVGHDVSLVVSKAEKEPGEPVLSVKALNVKNARGHMGLKNFSVTVHRGEIVGIAGVDGNGQAELVDAITGLTKVEGGEIMLNGTSVLNMRISERIDKGLSHIPEDRQKRGLVLEFPIHDNAILGVQRKRPFSKRGLLDKNAITAHAQEIIAHYDVRTSNGEQSTAQSLSGGNQQKVIIGREIEKGSDLIIAVQPTRGLDVGSIEYVHKRIVALRDNNKAVLLVSLELDEVLQLSDRIIVLYSGESMGELEAKKTDENEVGLLMAGIRKGGDPNGN
ncbi:MAG: ABC transporter ATP-binding protein [Clostridia bacterium]